MTASEILDHAVCNAALSLDTGLYYGIVDTPDLRGKDRIEWTTALYYKTETEALAAAERLLAGGKAMAGEAA